MFEGFYVVVEDNDLWLYATEAGDDEGYPVRNLGEVVPVTEVVGAIWEHKNEKERP